MKTLCMSAFNRSVLEKTGSLDADAIDSIVMVGALARLGAPQELSENDDRHLNDIITYGTAHGLTFSPTLSVIVSNIVYGTSFVREEFNAKAPLVAFCMIYYNPKGTEYDAIDKRFYRQEAGNFVEGSWHAGLVRTQADWAINIHDNHPGEGPKKNRELPTDFVARNPFQMTGSVRVGFGQRQMDFMRRLSA